MLDLKIAPKMQKLQLIQKISMMNDVPIMQQLLFYVIMKVKSPGKSNSNLLLFVQRYGGKGIILPTDDKKNIALKILLADELEIKQK